jgi:hypothetical protein
MGRVALIFLLALWVAPAFAHKPSDSYLALSLPLLALVELLSKFTELALPLRTEAAESDFLHPVCDSSHQQFAARCGDASAL